MPKAVPFISKNVNVTLFAASKAIATVVSDIIVASTSVIVNVVFYVGSTAV